MNSAEIVSRESRIRLMAHRMACDYGVPDAQDDLAQAARIAIWHAKDHCSWRKIEWAMIDEVRKVLPYPRITHRKLSKEREDWLDTQWGRLDFYYQRNRGLLWMVNADIGEKWRSDDDTEREAQRLEFRAWVEARLWTLTEDERRAIRHKLCGSKWADVKDEVPYSESRFSQIGTKAIRKLAEQIDGPHPLEEAAQAETTT